MNIIAKKYNIIKKISEGNFGTVFLGNTIKTQELVAIKLEKNDITLKHETKILNYLYSKQCRKIPPVYWYGTCYNHNCLVIPYYEISLFDYMKTNRMEFSNITKIMIQMINIFSNIHSLFVLHRDIKPQNIMIFNKEIYLIDFGLSCFYIDENGEHYKQETKENIIGTSKYISLNIHNGSNVSRRDDLISLGYIFMYLCLGSLPWEKIEGKCLENKHLEKTHINHHENLFRRNMKQWLLIEPIIHDFGEHFTNYMKYCYNLEFDETPNYIYMCNLFN